MAKLLLLFLVLITYACSTPLQRELSADDEQRLRTMTEDRRTWVDPIRP